MAIGKPYNLAEQMEEIRCNLSYIYVICYTYKLYKVQNCENNNISKHPFAT